MITHNKDYLRRIARTANHVEVCQYNDPQPHQRLHGDFIHATAFDSVDDLPDRDIMCDVEVMDEDEYNDTILANSDLSFEDIYDAGDTVCVIVLDWAEQLDDEGEKNA